MFPLAVPKAFAIIYDLVLLCLPILVISWTAATG